MSYWSKDLVRQARNNKGGKKMLKAAKREQIQTIGFVVLLISLTTIVMSALAVSAEEYSKESVNNVSIVCENE